MLPAAGRCNLWCLVTPQVASPSLSFHLWWKLQTGIPSQLWCVYWFQPGQQTHIHLLTGPFVWKGCDVSGVTAQQQLWRTFSVGREEGVPAEEAFLLTSCSALPVSQGNNQTHGQGSHRSRLSRAHPSRCRLQAYFGPVGCFSSKNGNEPGGTENISVGDSWRRGKHSPYLCLRALRA